MVKILNKITFHLKNIMLPILLIFTIYIVSMMFQRLGKNLFGEDMLEFIEVIAPFVLLIILNLLNLFLSQKEVRDNVYYNMTSFLVMVVITIFAYRACFDGKMYFLHQYSYRINFNYFADQIAAIKVMLYGLSFGNIILMLANYVRLEDEKVGSTKEPIEEKKNHVIYNYEKEEDIKENDDKIDNQDEIVNNYNKKKETNQNKSNKKVNKK